MEKYKIIVLINCHENKDVVCDVIDNVFKYNDSACVLINNGTKEDLSDLNRKDVIVIDRKPLDRGEYQRFDTMIPLHLDLYDAMLQHNIQSEYVVLMSSNQLFVNRGMYDFMSNYDGSYFDRPVDMGCIRDLVNYPIFQHYYSDLGPQSFKYQSNHDGMFFKYNVFADMMYYLKDLKCVKMIHHAEEFLYPAYMVNKGCNLVSFEKYNYWQPVWMSTHEGVNVEEVKKCIDDGFFLVKRVNRDLNNEARTYIRSVVFLES